MGLFEKGVPLESITVMVQKEVADRMQVGPGTKDYGALSLAVQYYSVPKVCFNVSPGSFYPPPKVTSSVIRLDVKGENDIKPANEKNMFRLIRAAFTQRRKTFVNSVSSTLGMPKAEIEAALAEIGENPMVRPEKLSLTQFSQLSDILMK
jgi:16S rRNA (adenine1518-N6/adenine1519-N6)-dimethyltransferase